MAPPTKPIRTVHTLIKKISDISGIRILTLEDPDHWELPPAQPGSHIDIHLPNKTIRTYSLCGDNRISYEYKIAVKNMTNSRGGSAYIHRELKVGDTLMVSLPRCSFPPLDPKKELILIAGGIGVTPFLSMVHELNRLKHTYELHLYYRGGIPLKQELASLADSGKITFHNRANPQGYQSISTLIGEPRPDTQIYCCGPVTMIEELRQTTEKWDPSQVAVEYFVPPAQNTSGKAYSVVLQKSGLTLDVPAGSSALHVIQSAGVDLGSACEGGVCGACKVRWLEGKPVHQDLCLSESERKEYFMPCVGSCDSPTLVIDL